MRFDDMPGDVQFIIGSVALENGMTVEEMLDRSTRRRVLSYARFEAMARIRELGVLTATGLVKCRYSLIQTGKFFDADHTTVLHALKRREAAVKELTVVLSMMSSPGEVSKTERAMKTAIVRQRLLVKREQWYREQERKRNAKPEPVPAGPTEAQIKDARHVEACLKQGGFCHFSERAVRMGNGGRDMQACLPVVWPVADQISA
jgi:hypothetical protein